MPKDIVGRAGVRRGNVHGRRLDFKDGSNGTLVPLQSLWQGGDWNGFAILVRGVKKKCRGRKVGKPVSDR